MGMTRRSFLGKIMRLKQRRVCAVADVSAILSPMAGGAGFLIEGELMRYVVKAAPVPPEKARSSSFDEKTMYRGKDIRAGDEIFVFASDHQGGRGLIAKGVVTSAARGPGIRVSIDVKRTAIARRNLGRVDLKPYCNRVDRLPQTEIARKLYRQATNKIAGISDEAADFLDTFF
jgi:hypothetical protein